MTTSGQNTGRICINAVIGSSVVAMVPGNVGSGAVAGLVLLPRGRASNALPGQAERAARGTWHYEKDTASA